MDFDYGLYPVITEEFCNGRTSIEVLRQVIDGGARLVQLREKKISKREFYQLAVEYRKLTRDNNVCLIINDHIDIALSIGADGVHLGQDDLPVAAARKLSSDLIIGTSTHSQEDIDKAVKEGATYVNLGPIFATNTKTTSVPPLGLSYLKSARVSIPFTVMGGIKKDNITDLLSCGARNIAMVTEITQSDNIVKTVSEIVKMIEDYKRD